MKFILILWALATPLPETPADCPPGLSYQNLCPVVEPLPLVNASFGGEFQNLYACQYALADVTEQTGGTVKGKCYVSKLPTN